MMILPPNDDAIVSHDASRLGFYYTAYVTSFIQRIPRSRFEAMACFCTCMDSVASA